MINNENKVRFMIQSKRFNKILEEVNKNGIASISELSKMLGVTETTVRRDSEELEKQGLLIRVHGGVKSLRQETILSKDSEKNMKERTENYDKKDQVARKASVFIKDGDCVFIDGGSSMLPLAKYINNKKLNVVTNNGLFLDINRNDSDFIFLGGSYIYDYMMTAGPIAENNLRNFNFDIAFISCVGIDVEKGLAYTADLLTTNIKTMAIKQATKAYLLVDSSKINRKGFYSSIKLIDFDAIITDNEGLGAISELPNNFIIVDMDE